LTDHVQFNRSPCFHDIPDEPEKGCDVLDNTLPDQTSPSVTAEPPAAITPDEASVLVVVDPKMEHVTLLASRGGDGLGMSFKVVSNGRVFRLEPARDPDQPRFWCFRVYRCTAAGVADDTERSWWGGGGMNRNDLAGAVQAIKDDLYQWLTNPSLIELHDWIMTPVLDRVEPGASNGPTLRATR
jgi:hypothetical protein